MPTFVDLDVSGWDFTEADLEKANVYHVSFVLYKS